LSPLYARRLRDRTTEYVKQNNIEVGDVSEYLYHIKDALAAGLPVNDSFLTPAHFLLTMRESYDDRRYSEVVKLCDRILQSARFLEKRIVDDIRYFLCQSLARQRNDRFLREVSFIQGSEHDFLLGFYYRLQGRFKDAVERQMKAMATPRSEKRARRELVENYVRMEDFDKALSLARENYNLFPSNPFIIQSYGVCLLQQSKNENNKKEILNLIGVLESLKSETSLEMAASSKAEVIAIYDNDEMRAYQIIDDAIATYPSNVYPRLTKMDISVRFLNAEMIRTCLQSIRSDVQRASSYFNSYKRSEAILAALEGDKRKATRIVENEMRNYSDTARARLLDKISSLSP
jgi:tetratricopeptide (TPR) repeat protein